MDIEGQRRSERFEDRGRGAGGPGRGGLPIGLLADVLQRFGVRGTLLIAAVVGVGYFFMPAGLRQMLFGGGGADPAGGAGTGSACGLSPVSAKACDFSRAVLASTEDAWKAQFAEGRLPDYGAGRGTYQDPTLVVFSDQVQTDCGNASAAVGPFYCGADRKLFLDPTFYTVMEKRLRAPGDFAQAYVIAHEVGHHVQNLIGASALKVRGETRNQVSVRVELQADCFAGVWGRTARTALSIDEADLREALNAAHAIGDDTLGNANTAKFTHGSSAQRMRWFKRGFDSGDARQCDTFAVRGSDGL